MGKRLTLYIVIAMIAGIGTGYALNVSYPAGNKSLADIADMLKLLPEVFLHLIKMIIAPLILATLVTGIASMGDSAALGRIGGRALAWFITASLISISLGLINLFPIPMLDGGHLVFYAFEAVRGRPLGPRAQEYGFRLGLVLVVSLMVFATWQDLVRLRVVQFVVSLVS